MSPLQAASIAHAQADGLAPAMRFNGKPLWQDYADETSAVLVAFLGAVIPATDDERSFLEALKGAARTI
jgi:hypothetical protein